MCGGFIQCGILFIACYCKIIISAWKATFGQNFRKLWRFAAGIWATVSWFLWRLGEIHIFKVVAFVVIMVAVYEVSVINYIRKRRISPPVQINLV